MAIGSRKISLVLAVENADAALKALRTFGAAGEAELGRIAAAAPRAAAALEATSTQAVRSSGAIKGALGQVGFQVQDLVVQIQAGQSPLTALIQQGTQLAGAFGPAGVAIGTVAAIVAAAAGAFFNLGQSIDAAAQVQGLLQSIDDTSKAYDRQIETVLKADEATRKLLATQALLAQQQTLAGAAPMLNLLGSAGGSRAAAAADPALPMTPGLMFDPSVDVERNVAIAQSTKDYRTEFEQAIRSGGGAAAVYATAERLGLLGADTPPDVLKAIQDLGQRAEEYVLQRDIAEVARTGVPVRTTPSPSSPSGATGSIGGGTGGGIRGSSGRPSAATLASQAQREAEAKEQARQEAEARLQAMRIKIAEAEAEATGRAYAASYNEGLADEQATNAAMQANLLAEPFINAQRQVQGLFADAFTTAFRGGVTSAQDAADQILEIFTGMAGQLAALQLFKPGGMLDFEAGATLGSAAPALFEGTALAGTSLGGLSLAGGLGATAGGTFATATGGSGMGGAIGGGLGAAVGFAVGGVPGALIGGALGSIAGSILGPTDDNSGDNNANLSFNPNYGSVGGKNTNPDPQNLSIVQQITDQLKALREGLLDMGATVGGDSIQVGAGANSGLRLTVNGQSQTFSTSNELSVAALQALIAQSTGGLTADQRTAAANSEARDAAGLLADLDVPERIAQAINPLSQAGAAAKALQEGFKGLIADAERLGLSTRELEAAQAEQLAQLTQDIRDTTLDPLSQAGQAAKALAATFDGLIRDAELLGLSVDEIEAARDAQQAQLRQGIIDTYVRPLSALGQSVLALDQIFAGLIHDADLLGLSVDELTKAHKAQTQQLIDGALEAATASAGSAAAQALGTFDSLIDPLAQFRQATLLGQASPLSGRQRLGLSRSAFNDALQAANQGGTTAEEVANVTRLAQQLLDASRAVNGSSGAFVDDFRSVNQGVLALQTELSKQRAAFERSLPAEIRAAADRQVDLLAQALAESKRTVAELRELRTELGDILRRQAAA